MDAQALRRECALALQHYGSDLYGNRSTSTNTGTTTTGSVVRGLVLDHGGGGGGGVALGAQADRRALWALAWPAQAVIAVSHAVWCTEVHAALDADGARAGASAGPTPASLGPPPSSSSVPVGLPHGLGGTATGDDTSAVAALAGKLSGQLASVVALVRGKLTNLQRMALNALVVLEVHARDVTVMLVKKTVSLRFSCLRLRFSCSSFYLFLPLPEALPSHCSFVSMLSDPGRVWRPLRQCIRMGKPTSVLPPDSKEGRDRC